MTEFTSRSPLEDVLEMAAKPMKTPSDAALISIAVSLKRLADGLCPTVESGQMPPLLWIAEVLGWNK